MNRLQVKYTSIFILLLSLVMVVGACSNDKKEQDKEKEETVVEEPENSNGNGDDVVIDEQEDEEEIDEQEKSLDQVEHQEGLKIGDKGTVVSGTLSDNERYEITLNDFQSVAEESVEGESIYHEIFLKANVTLKNIDDKALSIDSIFEPSVGDENLEDIELFPPFRVDYFQEDKKTKLEGETIEPGETVVIDYYFDTNQADMYRFAFGNSIDQIVAYAQWNISKDEM